MIPATAALLAALGRARLAVHPAARRERPGKFGEVPGGGYKPRGAAAQSAAPLNVFVQPFVAQAPSPVANRVGTGALACAGERSSPPVLWRGRSGPRSDGAGAIDSPYSVPFVTSFPISPCI